MLLEERLGCGAPAEPIERQRLEDIGSWGPSTLEELGEEDERPLGLPVEHRRRRGHQHNLPVRGTGRNRFLGERQEGRTARPCR
jgi:hypothetical protein